MFSLLIKLVIYLFISYQFSQDHFVKENMWFPFGTSLPFHVYTRQKDPPNPIFQANTGQQESEKKLAEEAVRMGRLKLLKEAP